MKLEEGDAFESEYADWIRERLPSYEPIWSAFIGHDGRGWPLPIDGLNQQEERNRKKFYQAHYTFAVQVHQLDKLIRSIDAKAGTVGKLSEFLAEQRGLTQVVTLTGQIRDMFKIIDEALLMEGALCGPLQDFYAMRSHVLHGPRMPVRLEDNFLMIPKIALQNAAFGEWDDKSTWDEIDADSFVYFADFCRSLGDELFALLGELHPKVFPAADKYFQGRRVAEDRATGPLSFDVLSGLSVFPAISAYNPPSGLRSTGRN